MLHEAYDSAESAAAHKKTAHYSALAQCGCGLDGATTQRYNLQSNQALNIKMVVKTLTIPQVFKKNDKVTGCNGLLRFNMSIKCNQLNIDFLFSGNFYSIPAYLYPRLRGSTEHVKVLIYLRPQFGRGRIFADLVIFELHNRWAFIQDQSFDVFDDLLSFLGPQSSLARRADTPDWRFCMNNTLVAPFRLFQSHFRPQERTEVFDQKA